MLSQKAEREEGKGGGSTLKSTHRKCYARRQQKGDNHEASPETSLIVDLYHQNYEEMLLVLLSLRSSMQQ